MASQKAASENTAEVPAEVVAQESAPASGPPPVVGAPPIVPVDPDPKPGPGQVVVVSPTGFRSVVDEHAVDSLKHQGYVVA